MTRAAYNPARAHPGLRRALSIKTRSSDASSNAFEPAARDNSGCEANDSSCTGRWQVGADYGWQEPSTGASGEDTDLFERDHRDL
jgi:hypothetical protein